MNSVAWTWQDYTLTLVSTLIWPAVALAAILMLRTSRRRRR